MMNKYYFNKLKVVTKEGNRAWSLCPYHKDTTRPNLSITLTPDYYGTYRCWACGQYGRLSDEQMNKLSLQVTEDNVKRKTSSELLKLKATYIDNLNKYPLLSYGLAKEFNVNVPLLKTWQVGYDGSSFCIPMYDMTGIRGIQRRFPDGYKCCVEGSRLGYFMRTDMWREELDFIFMCEGFSDTIAVNSLGFVSIGRPNCSFLKGITDLILGFEYEELLPHFVIIPDNDKVGIDGANALAKEIKYYADVSIFKFDGARDIREYIKLKGKPQVQKELGVYG